MFAHRFGQALLRLVQRTDHLLFGGRENAVEMALLPPLVATILSCLEESKEDDLEDQALRTLVLLLKHDGGQSALNV
jgi:hypothetical protein